MAEITRADIQAHFPVSELSDGQIDFALAKAIAEIKSRVGATAYADAIASSPADATAAALINEAAELFTVARLMRNTGLRFRANGLVIKETDAGSPALGSSSQITNQYLTPAQQIELAESYRQQGLDALSLVAVDSGATLYTLASAANTATADSVRRQTSSEHDTEDDE